jgi:hypothetical protein
MSKLLKIGDVFELKPEMECYANIPARFAYSNTPNSSEIVKHGIIVGDILTVGKRLTAEDIASKIVKLTKKYSDFDGVTIDKKLLVTAICVPQYGSDILDTKKYIGEYVAYQTSEDGGGTGNGPNDIYSDGHLVKAIKLNNGKFDKKGLKISFYQTGSFTAMNEEVKVLRTMKMEFK